MQILVKYNTNLNLHNMFSDEIGNFQMQPKIHTFQHIFISLKVKNVNLIG